AGRPDDDRRLRTVALARRLPHAGVRPGIGGDDGAAPARPDRRPHAVGDLGAAAGDRRRTGRRRAQLMASDSAAPLLAVEALTMRFGGLMAVDALSFAARAGEITAL